MAKQNRSADPTAAALSAIESALSLGKHAEAEEALVQDPAMQIAAEQIASAQDSAEGAARLPNIDDRTLFANGAERLDAEPQAVMPTSSILGASAKGRAAFQAIPAPSNAIPAALTPPLAAPAARKVTPSTPPANDDRRNAGQILKAMNVRASSAPLLWAIAATLLWVGLCALFVSTNWATLSAGLTPQTALLAVAAIGPVIFFFVTAALMRRTQEMRLTARSMTEVAMRLAEPEALATEQVVTLSQAIRREVASMGDGIERALARASELETLVHSEVSNLERSYGDNERRIRSLIDLLSNEREAIITNADRVRTAISGAQQSLSGDLATASAKIAEDVDTAGARVTYALGAKGEEISMALGSTGDHLIAQISTRGDDMVNRLSKTGQEVDAHLVAASSQVASALAERLSDIDQRLSATGQALIVDLGLRGTHVVDSLDQVGERISATISASGDGLVARLSETGERMHETVTVHGRSLDEHLAQTGARIAQMIGEHTQVASTTFTTAGDELNSNLAAHHAHLIAQIHSISDEISGSIGTHSSEVVEKLVAAQTSLAATEADFAKNLDAQHAQMATHLQSIGDGISATVANHSNELVDRINDVQGRLHETIVVHGRALDDSLAATGETLGAIIAERTSAARDIFAASSVDLTSQLDAHHHSVKLQLDAHAALLSENFAATSSTAVAAIAEQADTLHTHFADKADRSIVQLHQITGDFHDRFDRTAADHVGAMTAQHEAFHVDFNAMGNALATQLAVNNSHAQSQFTQTAQGATDGIGQQVAQLNNHFSLTASDAIAAIGTHGDRINQTLADRLNTFERTIGTQGISVEQRIDAQSDRLTNAIDQRLTALEEAITQRGDALDEQLAERARHTADDLDARVSSFDERSSRKTNEIAASFDALISRVDTGLETRARALNEVLAHRALEVARVLGEGGREVTRALDDKAIEIDQILLTRSDALTQTLSAKAQEINTTLGGRATEIAATLDNRIAQFEEKVVGRLDEVSHTIDNRGNSLANSLAERSNQINTLFSDHGNTFRSHMDRHAEEITGRLQASAANAQNLLGSTTQALSNSAAQIDGLLTSHATRFQTDLDGHRLRLTDALATTNDAAAAAIDAAAQSLLTQAGRLDQTFNQNAETFHQHLLAQTEHLADTLTSSTDQSKAMLDTANRTLDTTLSNRARDLGATLVARLNEIDATMTTRLGAIHSALGERGRELHETLAGRTSDLQTLFDTKGTLLVELLSERGGDIARELANVGEMVAHAIDNRGTSIVQQLGQKQIELTGAIDQSTSALRMAIDGGANQSVASLVNLSDQLKGELGEVIDRLEATNISLGTLVSNAGYNLSSIDGALNGRMKDFSQALGAVSNQVAALNQTATVTLQDGHALASRIDGHAKALSASAASLALTQTGVDATLETRRASLEGLLAQVNSNTADFESMTRAFGQLVDEAFLGAEARARDIGTFLTQSSQQTAGMIGMQYDDIRKASEAERGRMSASLRATAEQTRNDLADVMAHALERFKSTAGEMRGMSDQIQRELEATRAELERGIGEIPAETAEQAGTMRRVVAEQIRALNELTDIVVKSGRAHDVAFAEVPRLDPPQAPRPAAVAHAAAPAAEQVAPAPKPAPNFAPSAPARVQATPSTPPAAPAKRLQPERTGSQDRGGGWLSDLLARASQDDKPQSLRPTLPIKEPYAPPAVSPGSPRPGTVGAPIQQPLEALSLDIASMVDPNAASGAWDRYRRGDNGAFDRRIYTAQGQKTFDEIKRRYASDGNFRVTVDRYAQEFERLLADTSRDDRDGTVARNYLMSDTGKIYTLLAHAAGRLG